MSYSFIVTAPTKVEAKRQIAENMDNVVTGQPTHAADRDAAVAAGNAFVDMLVDPQDGEEITVSMYGSLSWVGNIVTGARDPVAYTSSGIGVTAGIRVKQVA